MSELFPMKWIGESDIRRVLTWDKLVPAMLETLEVVCRPGSCEVPLRARIFDKATDGLVLAMPGLVRTHQALATKILTQYPHNSKLGVPALNSLLLDGNSITELRTAAASAASTLAVRRAKELPEKVSRVAVLGAGVQGRAHARVMAHTLKPSQVHIWSRSNCSMEVELLRQEGVPAVECESVQEATQGADVICVCTSADIPFLKKEFVTVGAHVNSVGAMELDKDLVRSAVVYTDSKEAALKEPCDILLADGTVTGEIGDIISGSLQICEKSSTTIFKSFGLAAEDAVAARLVYDAVVQDSDLS